jgi:23S rRNA pseudouridine2605 synthase
MRINQFVAQATGLGRRKVDALVDKQLIKVNGEFAKIGMQINSGDEVIFSGKVLQIPDSVTTILLDKPVGYVCSRDGQSSRTIYDLLPKQYSHLKSIGRLDKDSSGLIVLTNDGKLAQEMSHPSNSKIKIYVVILSRELTLEEIEILKNGQIRLDKKPSVLKAEHIRGSSYRVTLSEGRNRQIRRTFEKLEISVTELQRISFGPYRLNQLKGSRWSII